MEDCERMYVATDVANLWRSCRDEFGALARVDFQILSEMMRGLRYPNQISQQLVAYIVTDPKQGHHSMSQVLRSFGYQIRERFLRHHKGMKKPTRSDWDVGITVDAIDRLNDYDTFVLCSGDGDFVYLLEYLKVRGKRVVVLTFEKSTALSLYETADELHILKGSILYQESQLVKTT